MKKSKVKSKKKTKVAYCEFCEMEGKKKVPAFVLVIGQIKACRGCVKSWVKTQKWSLEPLDRGE